jgi:hypothetical protein
LIAVRQQVMIYDDNSVNMMTIAAIRRYPDKRAPITRVWRQIWLSDFTPRAFIGHLRYRRKSREQ